MAMKLYNYFRSSASYCVRIAPALKGLDYDYIPVHLQRNEQFAESRMPRVAGAAGAAAEDGDNLVSQSLAIIEYLEETHPQPPLLPADAAARARVRALALDIACEIHPLNNLRVLRYLVKHEGQRGRQGPLVPALGRDRPGGGRAPPGRQRPPAASAMATRRRWPTGAGAADPQRAALRVPARPRADRDARVRGLHGAAAFAKTQPRPARPRPDAGRMAP